MTRSSVAILRRILLMTTCLVSVAALDLRPAQAQLKGLAVAAGQVSVQTPNATTTVIQQSSEKAILNWQSFSIPGGSSVVFQQPNSAAIALNRVLGPSSSIIDGNLTANGQVWLINPNGILFGHGSQINVGGLIATTSDIADQDFLAGDYSFGIGSNNPNAAVVNHGKIAAASGGSVVLAGARVDNQGLIEADLGSVVLGGANGFAVDFTGDKLLSFAITTPVDQQPVLANGQAASALVTNGGKIAAAGGKVLLTARAARDVLDNVINTTGIIEATSASAVNGTIVLDAGPTGTANAGGTLDASGNGAGQTGGTVEVLGDTVNVQSGASLDVAGDAGGGTILVGGNFHGAGPQQNATTTSVAQGAVLNADALTTGDGGQVAVWSTASTSFAGSISARGGGQSGNGGSVETSGGVLQVASSARVDTSAPQGVTGDWLLDPENIVIENGGTTPIPASGVLPLSQDSVSTDTIDSTTLANALSTSNITLQAFNNITVLDPVVYASGTTLALMSEGSIQIDATVQNLGGGALDLIAGWDGATPLASLLNASLTSGAFGRGSGDVTLATPSAAGISVGTAAGTTTVEGTDLTIVATVGRAQLGDSDPAPSGNITVALTGNLTMLSNGSLGNNPALIGNSNSGTTQGSLGGNITVNALGSITLDGGAGPGGFAQIGNVGTGVDVPASFAVTGNINVSATHVNLVGGVGPSTYAQIGNGRYLPSAGTTSPTATSLYSGAISVTATQGVSLQGGSAGGYAQIGNGGAIDSFTNVGGGLTDQGNIAVTVGTTTAPGTLTLQAGVGADAYAQIGNGGSFVNSGQPATGTVSESGTIAVTVNGAAGSVSLAGNSSVSNSYAQIGSGDGAGTSAGNVDSNITLIAGQYPTLSGDAVIGNASDNGTVSGLVDIAIPATVSGTVYSDFGLTVLPDATVALLVDGTSEGSVAAGTNGAYDFALAPGVIPSSGADLLVYLLGGATKGNSFFDDATGSVGGLDIYGNYLRVTSSKGTLSAILGDLAVALGNNTGANFLFSTAGGGLSLPAANLEINATGSTLALDQPITAPNGAVVLDSTGAVTQSQPIAAAGLDLLGAGATYTLGSSGNAIGSVAGTTGTVSLTDGAPLAVGAVANTVGVTGTGVVTLSTLGDLTLDDPVSGAVTLATGGSFINAFGAAAIVATDGRWLVYAQNPADDVIGGLAYAFRQYGAPYPTAPIPASGNGFLYSLSPVLTVGLTGSVSKTYDGTIAAALTPANYTIAGLVGGDTATLNDPASGTYATANAGTGIAVGVSGLALAGAANGAATVYGYTLAATSASATIGTITPAGLTVGLTGTVSKTYDGTNAAVLAPTNYTLSGLVNGDSVTLNDPTSGTYATANAGSGIAVSVSGLALIGTTNYTLASTSAAATIGTITPAGLTVLLTGTVSKTYDGTTAATLTPANYTLSGLVNGDTVTLNDPTTGTYATANAGSGIGVSVSGLALIGTGNYTLASTSAAATIGTITPAGLTVGLTGTVSKAYDGTTAATLAPANYTIAGLVGGDTVTLNDPTTGTYATANASTGIGVSVSGLALIGAGNYTLTSTGASANIGTITSAGLTVLLTGTVSKTYDGTTAATLTPANYIISGLANGDSVTLNDPTSGTYATANAGTGIGVSVSGLALIGTTNYTLASTSAAATIGTITPAGLTVLLTGTVSKTYDGTTAATLTPANYTLSGLVNGDTVALNDPTTGTYATANAGSGIGVSVSGLALIGTGNYTLASTSAAAAIGTITPAGLTVGLTGTVSKTYDGTNAATLTPANYTLSGLVNGDSVTLNDPTSGTYATANTGSGIAVSVSGLALLGTGNYTLAATSAAADIGTITPATLAYAATPASIAQGSALPSLSGTVAGFVAGETLGSATAGSLIFTTPASAASAAGSYEIDGSGLSADNGNYVFVQAPQNATALTITAMVSSTVGLPPGTDGVIVSLVQPSTGTTPPATGSGGQGGTESGSGGAGSGGTTGPGALETLSNGPGRSTGSTEQTVTDTVALALDKFHGLPPSTRTIISGMLTEALPTGDASPHGVPPADRDFSSWGNEALWQ